MEKDREAGMLMDNEMEAATTIWPAFVLEASLAKSTGTR